MKFPVTPEYLDAAPQPLVDAINGLEMDILREICSRFRLTGELNEVAINDIRVLRGYGVDMKTIERMIAKHSRSTVPEVQAALDRVVELNRTYYNDLASKASITMPADIGTSPVLLDLRYRRAGRLPFNLLQGHIRQC